LAIIYDIFGINKRRRIPISREETRWDTCAIQEVKKIKAVESCSDLLSPDQEIIWIKLQGYWCMKNVRKKSLGSGKK